jgi:hypothetical protein
VRVNSLIEFLDAAADTKFISGPFDERGGIMIVGPPGSLKTTIIETAMENHPDCLICSDLNVQQWMKMKDEFVTNRYSALAFAEFEKLYQRHPATAANLEGIVKALVSEGYGTGPGGDPRMPRLKARSLVVGGITSNCFERKYEEWQKNGFIRRFIWMVIGVRNPEAIVSAIRRWERIDFGRVSFRPANRTIKVAISEERSLKIEKIMKSQPGLHGTGYVLMKKIVAVLEWKYNGNGGKVIDLLDEIAPSLGKNGDQIFLGGK